MVLGDAGCIEHDPFIDFEQTEDLNFEAGLFANLAPQRVFEALARLHDTARERPPVFERLASPFDQEDAVAFDNEGPNAENRAFGILAANIATLPWRRF
jgi:hypothetical protein